MDLFQSRSSTPQASSEAVPENNAIDDLLKQYAVILVDVKAMTLQVLVLWREEISSALPELASSQDIYVDPEGVHLPRSVLSRQTELRPTKVHSENS